MRYSDQNESAPDSLSQGRSFEQPSPEVCSQLAYVLISTAGMAPTCPRSQPRWKKPTALPRDPRNLGRGLQIRQNPNCMATIPIARRAPARRSAAPACRVIRGKLRPLRVHTKHASPSMMTLKQQALVEIKAAWQRIEKYNLEFGKVCCEWRDKFKAKGFRKEGDGVSPILDELGIPKSTAYWWMNQYEIST